MVLDKEILLDAVNAELEDRTTQARESGEEEEYAEELQALREMKEKIEGENSLSFREYMWLSEMCSNFLKEQEE